MSENNLSVLVLGGTGAIGHSLVTTLSNKGFDVYVTSRKRRESGKVSYIQGNAHDFSFIKNVLHNYKFDVIVDFMIYSTPEFANRHKFFQDNTGQYVYLSSSRVYADSNVPIREDSPRLLDVSTDRRYLQTDEYALSKARQEDILYRSGLNNFTIIRPYITYGDYRLQLGVLEKEQWLYRALKGKTVVFSEDIGEKYTTLSWGGDVANGIASIIGNKEALGEAFHITCGKSIQWKEVFKIYMDTLEKRLHTRPRVLMLKENPRAKWRKNNYQVVYDRLFDRKFDNSKINKFIDTTGFVKPEEGLVRCLDNFLNSPSFNDSLYSGLAEQDTQASEWTMPSVFPSFKQYVKYILRRTVLPKKY